MSNVKIHLPFYTKKILLELIELTEKINTMKIIHINKLKKKNLFKQLGKIIFDEENADKNIIILGDTKKTLVPMSRRSKLILKHKSVDKNKYNYYKKLGYDSISENELVDTTELFDLLTSSTSHVGGYYEDGELVKLDIYKLWFLTENTKSVKFEVGDVLNQIIDEKYMEKGKLKKFKIWGKVSLSNIRKHPKHMTRLKMADIKLPILMTTEGGQPQLIDGWHRLMKAYIMKEKYIPVKIINKKILDKALVN